MSRLLIYNGIKIKIKQYINFDPNTGYTVLDKYRKIHQALKYGHTSIAVKLYSYFNIAYVFSISDMTISYGLFFHLPADKKDIKLMDKKTLTLCLFSSIAFYQIDVIYYISSELYRCDTNIVNFEGCERQRQLIFIVCKYLNPTARNSMLNTLRKK